jgi:hypothetical protein
MDVEMLSPRHRFLAASCPGGSVFAIPPAGGLRIHYQQLMGGSGW